MAATLSVNERCSQLLKRHDLGATAGYSDFIESSNQLDRESIALISSLTNAILSNIDSRHHSADIHHIITSINK